jgi:hypothetical protein
VALGAGPTSATPERAERVARRALLGIVLVLLALAAATDLPVVSEG